MKYAYNQSFSCGDSECSVGRGAEAIPETIQIKLNDHFCARFWSCIGTIPKEANITLDIQY
jgi:hypothetical protein